MQHTPAPADLAQLRRSKTFMDELHAVTAPSDMQPARARQVNLEYLLSAAGGLGNQYAQMPSNVDRVTNYLEGLAIGQQVQQQAAGSSSEQQARSALQPSRPKQKLGY